MSIFDSCISIKKNTAVWLSYVRVDEHFLHDQFYVYMFANVISLYIIFHQENGPKSNNRNAVVSGYNWSIQAVISKYGTKWHRLIVLILKIRIACYICFTLFSQSYDIFRSKGVGQIKSNYFTVFPQVTSCPVYNWESGQNFNHMLVQQTLIHTIWRWAWPCLFSRSRLTFTVQAFTVFHIQTAWSHETWSICGMINWINRLGYFLQAWVNVHTATDESWNQNVFKMLSF